MRFLALVPAVIAVTGCLSEEPKGLARAIAAGTTVLFLSLIHI